MAGFVETMRLKEMAEEDIYFARRDRELIAELKRRREVEAARPRTETSGQPERSNPGS